MIRISTNNLEPGMILAKPVLDANGLVLFSENTELAAAWIERIQNMCIEKIFIQGMPFMSIAKEELINQLHRRFKHVKNEPHMELLKNIVQKHIEGLYG